MGSEASLLLLQLLLSLTNSAQQLSSSSSSFPPLSRSSISPATLLGLSYLCPLALGKHFPRKGQQPPALLWGEL